MEYKTIFAFFGNREVHNEKVVYERLVSLLDFAYRDTICPHGYKHIIFYCGGYGEFDALAAKAVDCVRKRYPEVKTEKILVTPYITPAYKERLDLIKDQYDAIIYPPLENVPPKAAIMRRNKWMADECDIIIAYEYYSYGCTGKILDYARRKYMTIAYIWKSSARRDI